MDVVIRHDHFLIHCDEYGNRIIGLVGKICCLLFSRPSCTRPDHLYRIAVNPKELNAKEHPKVPDCKELSEDRLCFEKKSNHSGRRPIRLLAPSLVFLCVNVSSFNQQANKWRLFLIGHRDVRVLCL